MRHFFRAFGLNQHTIFCQLCSSSDSEDETGPEMTESAPVKVSNLESVAVNQCQVRPVVSERAAVTVQTDGRRDEVGWFLLDC